MPNGKTETERRCMMETVMTHMGDVIGDELDQLRNACNMLDCIVYREITREYIAKTRDCFADAQRILADADSKLVDLAAGIDPME